MELANCLVAIGGDRGYTVPKYNVSAAEIAVLCQIHGVDAVFDVEPTGSQDRNSRSELERLLRIYPAKDDDNNQIVRQVYPGVAPVLHQELADLGLPDESFKALTRVTVERAVPKKTLKKAVEKPAPITDTAQVSGSDDVSSIFDDEEDVMN